MREGLASWPLQVLGLRRRLLLSGARKCPGACPLCLPASSSAQCPKSHRALRSQWRGPWEDSPLADHQLEMFPELAGGGSLWSWQALDQPRLVRNMVLAHPAWLITQP